MATLKERLEWLGGIAVIASLLLVAYEIRQNTDTASAQAVYELNTAGNELLLLMTTSPELGHLISTANANPDELDADEWFRYQMYVWATLNLYEAGWEFYKRGFVDESYVAALKGEFCQKTNQPGFSRAISSLDAWQDSQFLQLTRDWCKSTN